MNTLKLFVFFLLFLTFFTKASAARYQDVFMKESGMVSTYWKVPSEFKCHVKIPNVPTAFCRGAGDVIYHIGTLGTLQYAVNPDQYINDLLQKITSQANIKIINSYTIPEVTQHLLQQDMQMVFRNGQQTYTYAFDVENHDEKKVGTSLFVVHIVPNNGTPISLVDYYGISTPSSQVNDFYKIRKQLTEFVLSRKYDRNYIQAINSQHMQFLANLRAREAAFNQRQQIIHQNNMDALDHSYNAYKSRSAASDRMHESYIDSIHERRQMVDPNTGQQYQVEGYYDYNYVNPNDPDMHIQTDSSLYNPNINTNQGANYNLLEEN
jgi:hypothetical protein